MARKKNIKEKELILPPLILDDVLRQELRKKLIALDPHCDVPKPRPIFKPIEDEINKGK